MYFIITIISFLVVFFTSLTLITVVKDEGLHFFVIIVTVISGITTTITMFAMMFQNMYFRNLIRENVNYIRRCVKRIKEKNADLIRYKDEFKKILTEMYPEYEKEMFSKMAKSDAQQLEIMLVKYPDLKFDGILTGYIDGIKSRLNEIDDYEIDISKFINRIEDLNSSGWMLGKVVLPSDTQKLMEGQYA